MSLSFFSKLRQAKHLPALLIFIWLPLYGFIVVCRCKLAVVDGITYLFHCVDFSMGFCCRFLPGAVYRLICGEPTEFKTTVYEYIWLFLFYIVLAILLEKWYYRLPKNSQPSGRRLLLLYLSGTLTFAAFIYQPGMLDVSWIYLSVIFILLLQNKYTRFAAPLLMLPAVMIHFGVMLCYVPFWALLLLYEVINAEDKKEKKIWTALFFAACIIAMGSFFWFLAFNKKNIRYDIQEFNRIIESRGSDMTFYYDYIFYADPEHMEDFLQYSDVLTRYPDSPFSQPIIAGSSAMDTFINSIYYELQLHWYFYTKTDFSRVFVELLVIIFIMLPLFGMFFGFIRHQSEKQKENKLHRFFYFCMLMELPLAVFGSVLVSTDSVRWLMHGFICLFTLTLYIVFRENGKPMEYIIAYFKRFPPVAVTVWQVIYTFVIFNPYV